jgi:hypothetical protein
MVTVADCQRVQTSWYRYRAETRGGEVWTDGSLTWTNGPDGKNLMFPTAMTTAAVRRGVDRTRKRGLSVVGAWPNSTLDRAPLAEAGFTGGGRRGGHHRPVPLDRRPGSTVDRGSARITTCR